MKLGIWELLVILLIVVLLFGTKRLKTLGSDLGAAIRGFRASMSEGEAPGSAGAPGPAPQGEAQGRGEKEGG